MSEDDVDGFEYDTSLDFGDDDDGGQAETEGPSKWWLLLLLIPLGLGLGLGKGRGKGKKHDNEAVDKSNMATATVAVVVVAVDAYYLTDKQDVTKNDLASSLRYESPTDTVDAIIANFPTVETVQIKAAEGPHGKVTQLLAQLDTKLPDVKQAIFYDP